MKRARLAEAMEAGGLGGGTAAGDEAEGVRLAEDGAGVERAGGIGCVGRVRHVTGGVKTG